MLKTQKILLQILSDVIWKKTSEHSYTETQWEDILTLARGHGVLALALQGCTSIRGQMSPESWKKWFTKLLSTMVNNKSLMTTQSKLVGLMTDAGIPCAILKGSSLAACYHDPMARTLGDIDLLVAPQCTEQAADILRAQGFSAPKESYNHPYHIDFYLNKTAVELHFAASTFPDSAAGLEAKGIMESCWDSIQQKQIENDVFPCLSDYHQALSLMLHMERHMTTGCIGLRQLCDWAVFVKSVSPDYFAEQILPMLERCGLAEFACVLTKTCALYLGLDPNYATWCSFVKNARAEAMMQEILRAGNINQTNSNDEVSSFFVESSGEKSAIRVFIKKMNTIAKRKFPVTQKAPVLLPIFWVYIPTRYWIRSLMGRRTRKSVLSTIAKTKQRKDLYRELKLFKIDE